MTLWIDEDKVFRLIRERKPKGIVVNAPGGLLRQTRTLIEKIEAEYGIPCFLVGDSCFGICDTMDDDVTKLGADLALHIGHNAVVEEIGDFTHLIDAKDDVKFDAIIEKSIPLFKQYKRIGLATFSQHLDELEPARKQLEAAGLEVHLGRKNNLLLQSQTFGCDFSTIYPMSKEVDAFCYLGESEFHAVGVALATGKPTYLLDPYLEEIRDMKEEAEIRRKRSILAVYKALDARGLRRRHRAQGGPEDAGTVKMDIQEARDERKEGRAARDAGHNAGPVGPLQRHRGVRPDGLPQDIDRRVHVRQASPLHTAGGRAGRVDGREGDGGVPRKT